MDRSIYPLLALLGLLVCGIFFGIWYEQSNKHELRIECIKSGGELVENSCIRNRKAS